jgi:hypothetical protein
MSLYQRKSGKVTLMTLQLDALLSTWAIVPFARVAAKS